MKKSFIVRVKVKNTKDGCFIRKGYEKMMKDYERKKRKRILVGQVKVEEEVKKKEEHFPASMSISA